MDSRQYTFVLLGKLAAPMIIWLVAWFIIFTIRLRRVEADNSGLTIFSFFGKKKVGYKDIEYVSEVALLRKKLSESWRPISGKRFLFYGRYTPGKGLMFKLSES